MSTPFRLLAGAAFAWPALLGSGGAVDARVPPPAAADCMIRFEVANSFSEHRVNVALMVQRPAPAGRDFVWSSSSGTDRWLEPGESRAWYQTLAGQCGARRRYTFFLVNYTAESGEEGEEVVYHVPSVDGWSTRTELQLGDLARFFPGLEVDAPPEPEPTPPVSLPAPAPTPVPLPLPAPEPEPAPGPEVHCPIRFPVSNSLQEHTVRVGLTIVREGGGTDAMWGPPSGSSMRWAYPGQQTVWVDTVPGECDEPRRYSFVFYAVLDDVAQASVEYNFPFFIGQFYRQTEVPLRDLARHFSDLEGGVTPAPPEPTEPGPAPAPSPTPAPAPTPTPAPPAEPDTSPGAAQLTEDFSGVPEGGLPDYFEHLGGNAQVGSVDGRPALVMENGTWFRVPLGGDLGERFTIEFDYRSPSRFAFLYVAPFHAATASGAAGLHYRHIPFHHFAITTETIGVGVRGGMPDMPHAVSLNAAFTHGLVPIRLVVEGEAAAVFVDGEQVARLPRAEIPRTDVLEFFYHGNRGPGHIANLRVTSE